MDSPARRRGIEEGAWSKAEDVIQFMLGRMERGLSRVTKAGKLAGIAFVGKLVWGYTSTAGEMGKRRWKAGLEKRTAGAKKGNHDSGCEKVPLFGILPPIFA